MREGWTVLLPLDENGSMRGSLCIGKDTRRSPLPDALAEIVDVLRREMVKTLARFDEETGTSADATEISRSRSIGRTAERDTP